MAGSEADGTDGDRPERPAGEDDLARPWDRRRRSILRDSVGIGIATGAYALSFGMEKSLGKPAGHDLVEGIYTLPVIRALADTNIGDELRGLLGARLDMPTRDKARDMIRSTDALAASAVEARRFADQAAAALAPLGDGPFIRSLAGLGHRLVDTLDDI